MKGYLTTITLAFFTLSLTSCFFGKNKGKGLPDDGQLQVNGVAPLGSPSMTTPYTMKYIKPGSFHMGPSDEDISFSFSNRNRIVAIPGFWMDATEITNNHYRQFVNWVRDSLAFQLINSDGLNKMIADSKPVKWDSASKYTYDQKFLERISNITYEKANSKLKAIDPDLLIYKVHYFDLAAAAKATTKSRARSQTKIYDVPVYPDTLVWIRDFSYAYNEPLTKLYYAHPAYGNYPVVGVNWKQSVAFCHWRTHRQNAYLEKKKMAVEGDFRLPTEAEWEYAARGGRTNSMFPWGSPYLRNKKGCLMANFKPGRGVYSEDGAHYTVRADAYWQNDFGLYNMSGNVAEWTSSYYSDANYDLMADLSPDVKVEADDYAPIPMKKKVIRGGSWKDVGSALQVSARAFEYQDTAKSYIGFRTVIDLAPRISSKNLRIQKTY
jgi:gliding motility-associated lipoprotein GldK